ncbi:MAG: YbaN family protein, partial [Psychrobium sp.]|nr:YbaN family protein [Psychrobium sp.]
MSLVLGFKNRLGRAKKYLYFGAGILMLACGVIGIILPVMPTTIFFILALTCFTRSSSKMKLWLLNHPKFGSNLVAWKQYQVVPKKAKYLASISMFISWIIVTLTVKSATLILLIGFIMLLVSIYLFSKPSSIKIAKKSARQSEMLKSWPFIIFSALFLVGLS